MDRAEQDQKTRDRSVGLAAVLEMHARRLEQAANELQDLVRELREEQGEVK